MKVRKLSFWCCCDWCNVFLQLSSGVDYDGFLRLSEAEDPILLAFGEESRGNCPPFDRGRAHSHKSRCLEVSPTIQTGTHSHRPGTGKASKTTDNAKRIIEEQMNKDDETTGCELQKLLSKHGITVCASTALRWRQQLGWTSKGTSYCQMIREVNKEKRLAWAIKNKDMFLEDVIYTDETTVQIETHRRTCCYKKGEKPRYKPKPKHPIKVHVWAGISYRGRTSLCIFEGKMNAPLFVMILERCLVPFLRAVYPDGHHFVQDNDPKHCSNYARRFYEKRGISWWPTHAESPDLQRRAPILLVISTSYNHSYI